MNDSEILIFGGPYSNLEATTEIISIAEKRGIQASNIYCTGDIVGYCANPEETVHLIKHWGINTIAGNVELNLRDGEEDCGCNFDEGSRCDTFSQRWYPYAKIHLSETSINWMKQLPEIIRKEINGKKVVMIHGGIPNVSEFIFASTPWDRKQELFDLLDADVIFSGHSGLPFVQEKNDKLWINAGVIGMPANDGTPRTWFATVNPHTWNVKIHSFDYENEQAANKMIAADLPFEYAHTLNTGIWDNCEILPSIETKAQGIRIQEDAHWGKQFSCIQRICLFLDEQNAPMYTPVDQDAITFFQSIVGERCFTDLDQLTRYSKDETEDLSILPEVVLKPTTPEEISAILTYCNARKIAVTPSGARTGLSGGAIPLFGGVALSMENFNRILLIDEQNHQVTTEPGVITQVLQETVREKGLFYPPDPASKGSCFIGGNVSENSGGPKAVKYGVTNEYVLNLEVVLPTGEIIWTGANVLKNATGYNLTQLITGSEGTLGVITKIVLKLIPHPTHDLLLLVPFFSAREACAAVGAIFQAGITPSGLEFMERDALLWAQTFTGDSSIHIGENHAAHLLIEVDGFDPEILMSDCAKITEVLERFETDEILFAEALAQKDALWKLRRSVGEAVKSNSIYKEEDTVVPRFELPVLLDHIKRIGANYGFKSVCYGHAGDGNLHVNIIKGDLTDQQWNEELPKAIRELFTEVVKLGGTLSGEHGIGLVQKPYMDIAFGEKSLGLMRSIKHVFDPNEILNPGKIF